MTTRQELEAAIEAAVDAGFDPSEAIAVLDAIDGEPEDGEPSNLPPLMDGHWGCGLGRLAMLDRCPCCGRLDPDGYVLPVSDWLGCG